MVVATDPGDVLLGKYRVEEVIGVGGMGRVIRARHLYLQQSVAIKILLPNMVESKSTIARFLREAQATVRLRSEHIARVMDVGTMPDGAPFMVMEHLEGFDLGEVLRHHGPQAPSSVVDLMLQACEGISEAHAMGIVHRDIKPSNFFITRRPDGSCLLKILDFGISKTPTELSELTSTQTVVGTPMYMAPEQMRTARSTDPRSDIWSMGVVMYQMLTGRPPFEAETYAELVLKVDNGIPAPLHVDLPPGLAAIVMRCLEKDPRNRLQNVAALAVELIPYASDPIAGQQSADRTTRILSAPQLGGRALASTGADLTIPPARTPDSWNRSQTTQTSRGSNGLIVAGIVVVCIAAAIGGFAIANWVSEKHHSAAVPASPATQPPNETRPAPAGTAQGQQAPTSGTSGVVVAPIPPKSEPSAAGAEATAEPSDGASAKASAEAAAKATDEAAAKATEKASAQAPATTPEPTRTRSQTTAKRPAKKPPAKKTLSKPKTKKATASEKTEDLFDDRH